MREVCISLLCNCVRCCRRRRRRRRRRILRVVAPFHWRRIASKVRIVILRTSSNDSRPCIRELAIKHLNRVATRIISIDRDVISPACQPPVVSLDCLENPPPRRAVVVAVDPKVLIVRDVLDSTSSERESIPERCFPIYLETELPIPEIVVEQLIRMLSFEHTFAPAFLTHGQVLQIPMVADEIKPCRICGTNMKREFGKLSLQRVLAFSSTGIVCCCFLRGHVSFLRRYLPLSVSSAARVCLKNNLKYMQIQHRLINTTKKTRFKTCNGKRRQNLTSSVIFPLFQSGTDHRQ